MDKIIERLEYHTTHLEELVGQRTAQLYEEKQRTENLLHMMLPPTIAKQLAEGNSCPPESYPLVTIYFSDIVGFTSMSDKSTPLEVITYFLKITTVIIICFSNGSNPVFLDGVILLCKKIPYFAFHFDKNCFCFSQTT